MAVLNAPILSLQLTPQSRETRPLRSELNTPSVSRIAPLKTAPRVAFAPGAGSHSENGLRARLLVQGRLRTGSERPSNHVPST